MSTPSYTGRLRAVLAAAGLLLCGMGAIAADAGDDQGNWPPVPGLGPDTCGPLVEPARHGPFDYRDPPPEAIIANVEAHHFNHRLRAMKLGKDSYAPVERDGFSEDSGGTVGGGFSYTLHAFPNHARALQAVDEYSRRKAFATKPPGMEYPVECYFERAIRFAPDDSTVRYLYASFLEARGRHAEADQQIALIQEVAAGKPGLAYNLGLLYVKRGQLDKALEYARVAYRGGYNLPGLRKFLVQKKHWDPAIDAEIERGRSGVKAVAADQKTPSSPQAEGDKHPDTGKKP